MNAERSETSLDLQDTVNKGFYRLVTPEKFTAMPLQDLPRYQLQAIQNSVSHRTFLASETGTIQAALPEIKAEVQHFIESHPEMEEAKMLLSNIDHQVAVFDCSDRLGIAGILCSSKFLTHIYHSRSEHFKRAADSVLEAMNRAQETLDKLPRPRLGFALPNQSEENGPYQKQRAYIRTLSDAHAQLIDECINEKQKEQELPR